METLSNPTLIPPPPGARTAWPPPVAARSHEDGPSWAISTIVAACSIWTAVVLISVFSPDMISGSEHQRLPVAAFTTWFWATGATIASIAAMARLRVTTGRRALGAILSGATVAIWSAATVFSIFGPTMVTGSDPTTMPLAAVISPVVAMVATILLGTAVLVGDSLTRPHA